MRVIAVCGFFLLVFLGFFLLACECLRLCDEISESCGEFWGGGGVIAGSDYRQQVCSALFFSSFTRKHESMSSHVLKAVRVHL